MCKQLLLQPGGRYRRPPYQPCPKPSMCFGFVLRSVGVPGMPLRQPISPALSSLSNAVSSAGVARFVRAGEA